MGHRVNCIGCLSLPKALVITWQLAVHRVKRLIGLCAEDVAKQQQQPCVSRVDFDLLCSIVLCVRACVRMCVCVCACACVHACVCACLFARMCMHLYIVKASRPRHRCCPP